jgi:hypothetical protein
MTTFAVSSTTSPGRSGLHSALGAFALALIVPLLAVGGLAVPLPSGVYRLTLDLIQRAEGLAVGVGEPDAPTSEVRAATIVLDDDSRPAATAVAAPRRTSVVRSATTLKAVVRPSARPGRASGTRLPAPAAAPRSPAAPKTGAATPATPTSNGDAAPAPSPAPTAGADLPGGAAPAPSPAPAAPSTPPATSSDPAPAQPTKTAEPVETTVDTVTETVGTVTETVDGTVTTVTDTVNETTTAVDGIVETLPLPVPLPSLPKLPPPKLPLPKLP